MRTNRYGPKALSASTMLILFVAASILSGCVSRAAIPVGELPAFTPPTTETITAARSIVEGQLGVDK